MRTIYWFASFWVQTLLYTPFLWVAKSLEKKQGIRKKRQYVHGIAQKWAKKVLDRTGSQIQVEGLEHVPADQAVLFVGNHQGNFDIPILLAYLPQAIGFVAKVELEKLPLISRWMMMLECVFMDRKDLRQSLRAMTQAIEILKSGHSMVIFPEGTRSKGPEIAPFKPGSTKLAERAKVPIIPITINGSYKILEANGNRIKPATVRVILSPPIYPWELDKTADLTVTTFQAIKDRLEN